MTIRIPPPHTFHTQEPQTKIHQFQNYMLIYRNLCTKITYARAVDF